MPTIYDLKPRFQALLRPIARGLLGLGASPNAVTTAALLGSVGVGALVLRARVDVRWLLVLPAWLFLRMALNAIDGMMAREGNRATPEGAALNEIGDVVSDLAIYLPLAAVHPPAAWAAIAFAVLGCLTEFSGLLAQTLGAGRRYDGPMGKSDRAFLVGALALATTLRPAVFAAWAWVLGAGAALAAWTCWNRARAGVRAARGEGR